MTQHYIQEFTSVVRSSSSRAWKLLIIKTRLTYIFLSTLTTPYSYLQYMRTWIYVQTGHLKEWMNLNVFVAFSHISKSTHTYSISHVVTHIRKFTLRVHVPLSIYYVTTVAHLHNKWHWTRAEMTRKPFKISTWNLDRAFQRNTEEGTRYISVPTGKGMLLSVNLCDALYPPACSPLDVAVKTGDPIP